jgi:hypothetical protein
MPTPPSRSNLTIGRELLEPQRVDPIRRHVESVARLIADHGVAADRCPEPRDLMLQGVERIGRFGVRPHRSIRRAAETIRPPSRARIAVSER